MDSNMLINLSRIFVYLRFDIKNPKNIDLIELIIQCISMKSSNKVLIGVLNGKFEYVEQLEQNDGIVKEDNNNICEFIIVMLEKAKDALLVENYRMAYDIIDLIHFLPELILNFDKKQIKKFWKNNVKTFSKKWSSGVAVESKHYFLK